MLVGDVKNVLDIVREKSADNDQLPNKELTLRVTILLVLTLSIVSALHTLDLHYMIKTREYYQFQFPKLH